MLLPFKLGAGGRLGNGHQWMSWIHVDDVVDIMLHATTHDQLQGAVNTVSPTPVTNREFTRISPSGASPGDFSGTRPGSALGRRGIC